MAIKMIDYFIGVTAIIICATGISGNCVTLFIIIRREIFANKYNAHMFIANLAIVDLLACICISITVVSTTLYPEIGNAEIPCGISIFGNLPIRPLALLSLSLLTVNRFYAIVKRNASQVFNGRRSLRYLCGVWCMCMLITILVLAVIGISSKAEINGACDLLGVVGGKLNAFLFVVISVCFSVITFCNIRLWLFVRSHNRRIAEENDQPADVVKAGNIKLGKLVAYMSLSYVLVFVLPAIILGVINTIALLPLAFRRILIALYTINHANNFIIFLVVDKKFRAEAKRIFGSCFKSRESNLQQAQT